MTPADIAAVFPAIPADVCDRIAALMADEQAAQ